MLLTARRRRPILLVSVASLLLVLSAACGSDDDSDADTGAGVTTTAAPSGDDYGATGGDGGASGEAGTIVAEDFSLTDLTAAPGEEIVLQNDGDTRHTATADDGSFDLEADGGATSDPGTAPTTPGDYDFHCEIHPNMTATLTVES
jgi:plastocyanin